ncbi:MAG: hypothetical protein AB1545_07565 [Thermodesulfobacteriota bacterium]
MARSYHPTGDNYRTLRAACSRRNLLYHDADEQRFIIKEKV